MRKRITLVTGHYGSGKTEFSVNLSLQFAQNGKKTALVDLDIANVYFRSREQQQLLESKGIQVHSNAYHYDITADLPALSASIRRPLEDRDTHTVIDVGGDDSGARVLKQFAKYFTPEETCMLCVINANRPETETVEGALSHIDRIEKETGMKIEGLVNNTHLLKETRFEDFWKGYQVCQVISDLRHIPIAYHCCTEELCDAFKDQAEEWIDPRAIFPIKLYMRPTWIDL
jgi:hypothetical protein